jgi:hypothetical protein
MIAAEPSGGADDSVGVLFFSMRSRAWLDSEVIVRFALMVSVCWAVALALDGSSDVLLFLAPALLIAIPLVSGRYIGETLIERLAAPSARRRRHSAVHQPPAPQPPAVWRPRGARLVALSLAKRPPPALRLLPQS